MTGPRSSITEGRGPFSRVRSASSKMLRLRRSTRIVVAMTTPPEGAPRRLRQLPEAVTYAREQAGLKQVELARRVGISYQLMSDIERGYRSATPAVLNKLAEVLNCPRVVLEAKHKETTG